MYQLNNGVVMSKKIVLFLLVLFSYSNALMSMQNSSNGEEARKRMYLKKDLDLNAPSVSMEAKQDEIKSDLELDEDPQLLREILEAAPENLQEIINLYRDPQADKSAYRYFMLAGPSSTGKTTLAKAIAFGLGRKYMFVGAPSLQGHHRNQTTENVHTLFEQVNSHTEHPVLIIDEFNALTDSYNQEHTDTADTAKGLWILLDQQKNNDNFLMIATTNETKKMPLQLQKRFLNKIIEIGNLDVAARKRMLQSCLQRLKNIVIAADCNDAYFNDLAQRMNNFDRRTIEAVINKAMLKVRTQPNKQLTSTILDEAYAYTLQHVQKFCDFSEHLTDDERRHKEALQQNKEHFEKNEKTHKEQFEISKQLQIKSALFGVTCQARMKKQGTLFSNDAQSIYTTTEEFFPDFKQ